MRAERRLRCPALSTHSSRRWCSPKPARSNSGTESDPKKPSCCRSSAPAGAAAATSDAASMHSTGISNKAGRHSMPAGFRLMGCSSSWWAWEAATLTACPPACTHQCGKQQSWQGKEAGRIGRCHAAASWSSRSEHLSIILLGNKPQPAVLTSSYPPAAPSAAPGAPPAPAGAPSLNCHLDFAP